MESEKEKNSEVLEKEIETKDEIVHLLKSLKLKNESTKDNSESFSFDIPKDCNFSKALILFLKEEEDLKEYLSLTDDLEEAQKVVYEKLLLLGAEFENYKKRSLQEKTSASTYAKETVLKDILGFIGNFERGLILYKEANKETDFYKGMSAVYKEFDSFLEKNNITKIVCSNGDDFDPTFHEAIEVSPSEDIPKDKIINIIQEGYLINEKLFRPVLVIVSSGKGTDNE